ncbi:unnamed protein product, partial [Urochloa humidicola]
RTTSGLPSNDAPSIAPLPLSGVACSTPKLSFASSCPDCRIDYVVLLLGKNKNPAGSCLLAAASEFPCRSQTGSAADQFFRQGVPISFQQRGKA